MAAMVQRARALFNDWKAADEKARQLELLLKAQWENHFSDGSPPPTENVMTKVLEMRAHANGRLAAAMHALQTGGAGS